MLELLEKIDVLKKSLDDHPTIQKLNTAQNEIIQDSILMDRIKKQENKVAEEEKIRRLHSLESEVNFMILEINQYLKEKIVKNSRCQNESD